MRAGPLLLLLSLAAPAAAGDISIGLPIDCTLGQTCYIQNYVDDDPGPGVKDFTCGQLSYNGHQGTDFALPSVAAMQTGVAVLASAPGTVRATRDGMDDIASNEPDAPEITGRDCGNGVVIDHADGWQTQYCHMRKGSVTVKRGDTVTEGAHLGLVGMSGRAEFPHVHITVRHLGKVVDPFDPDGKLTCGGAPEPTLWDRPVPYQPGGLIAVGMATAVPTLAAIHLGPPPVTTLPPDAPALVFWAYAFGSRPGDRIDVAITGPQGPLVSGSADLDRAQANFFRAFGKRHTADWPVGSYHATARMLRGDTVLGSLETSFQIGR